MKTFLCMVARTTYEYYNVEAEDESEAHDKFTDYLKDDSKDEGVEYDDVEDDVPDINTAEVLEEIK